MTTTLTIEAGNEMLDIQINRENMSYTIWKGGEDVSWGVTFGQRAQIVSTVQKWYLANKSK